MSMMVTEAPAPSARLHVVGELLHRGERRDVLHAVGLAGVGDDDELARAEELLVQLGVGDVVRVVGEEQRRARASCRRP